MTNQTASRRQWTLAALTMAAAPLAAWTTLVAAQPRDSDRFTILQARYGTPERNVDVTGRLQELARSDQNFRISNDTFGTDPDEGRQKTLRIIARSPNGETRSFDYREGDVVDGEQFAGWRGGRFGQNDYRGGWDGRGHRGGDSGQFNILQARYGTPERSVDVTRRLKELARSDQKFRISNDTFGTDPDEGRQKMLRIIARSPNGETRSFDYREGDVVDGDRFVGWRGGRWGQGDYRGGWEGRDNRRGDDGEFRILQARYGTPRRNVDVTQRLRELARADRKFRLENATFGVDPDEGRVKTLRIYARGPGGQERMFEYREGSVVDGDRFTGWGRGEWGEGRRRGGWGG